MLKGISPLVGPDLLALLHRMGHGDEILLADVHFPAESHARRLIRADGLAIPALLDGILPLFELDAYVDAPLVMMAPVPGDALDPRVEAEYRSVMARHLPQIPAIARIERFAFYERAREAFAIVTTGDTSQYANLILKKGVTLVGGRP